VKRLASATAAILALALSAALVAGCNANFSPYAAEVGHETITPASLDSTLSTITADKGYGCLVGANTRGRGLGSGTYSAGFVAFVLTNLVRSQVVQHDAAARHLPEPASAVPVATEQLRAGIDQTLAQDPSCGNAATVWSKLAGPYRNDLVRYQLAEDALAAAAVGTSLEPAALARYATSHPGLSREDCLSVIQVAKRSEAVTIRKAITGGASFATEARQHSVNSQSAAAGGAIGCLPPSQLVQPLSSVVQRLAVGQLSTPVSFQNSWLLLLVTANRTESDATLIAELFSVDQAAFSKALDAALRSAHVTIDPLYGSWSTSATAFGVVSPPKGPPSRFVPNPAAAEPVTSTTAPSVTPGG
jgi:hypothetical protein